MYTPKANLVRQRKGTLTYHVTAITSWEHFKSRNKKWKWQKRPKSEKQRFYPCFVSFPSQPPQINIHTYIHEHKHAHTWNVHIFGWRSRESSKNVIHILPSEKARSGEIRNQLWRLTVLPPFSEGDLEEKLKI